MITLLRGLTILFILSISMGISAQVSQTRVEGVLKDSTTMEEIPYATIVIAKSATPKDPEKVLSTDADGKFSFENGQGEYLLSVSYIGKIVYTQDVNINDAKKVNLGEILINLETNQLGEVEVTAYRPLVKVDLDKITYDLEQDPESKTSSVLDMLKKVPMITVDGDDQISLKGSSNYKIYMDGKPSSMIASNPKDVLRSMPASMIKDIEVITDPGAKYDAEGVAGIINIVTNKNSKMAGYTATINSNVTVYPVVDYSFGGSINLKYGKLGLIANMNKYEGRNKKGLESGSDRTHLPYNDELTGNLVEPNDKFMTSRSKSKKTKYDGIYGSAMLSYEIDTLNLVQVSYNQYGGNYKSLNESNVLMTDIDLDPQYRYTSSNDNRGKYGNTSVGADYQRTFSNVKGRLLTFSYNLNISPNDSDGYSDEQGILNYEDRRTKQASDGSTKEHTAQVDFVTPFNKNHSLETGAKYIKRINKSDSKTLFFNFDEDDWVQPISYSDEFKHTQDILGAYGSYSFQQEKWGVKAGGRYEGTWLNAEFPMDKEKNFDADYSSVVPSLSFTYKLKSNQNLRLTYNMRINRPGIWYLNPYVNTVDPLNVSYGNPDLDIVKYHNVSFNYGYFASKVNVNANISYNQSNNSIEQYSWTEADNSGVTYRTYGNIGKIRNVSASFYGSWNPNQKFRLSTNLGGTYFYTKSTLESGLSSKGFRPTAHANISYTIIPDLILSTSGGYFGPWRSLETKGSDYYFYGLDVRKSLMKKKIDIRLYAQNFFQKERRSRSTQTTATFINSSFYDQSMMRVGIGINFRFGELKEQIKKTARGISNEDGMSGGGQGAQSGGQGGGGN